MQTTHILVLCRNPNAKQCAAGSEFRCLPVEETDVLQNMPLIASGHFQVLKVSTVKMRAPGIERHKS